MTNVILPNKEKEYWVNEVPRVIDKKRILEPTAASINIVDGLGFGVNKKGLTVCIGPVDINGNPLSDAHQTTPASKNGVSKPLTDKESKALLLQAQNNEGFETSKNVGGRPRKSDDKISRTTRWRRQNEKQGVLL